MRHSIVTITFFLLSSFYARANDCNQYRYCAGAAINGSNGLAMALSDIAVQQAHYDMSEQASVEHVDIDAGLFAQYSQNSIVPYHHMSCKNPQAVGLNFTGITLPEVGLFPPDSMG